MRGTLPPCMRYRPVFLETRTVMSSPHPHVTKVRTVDEVVGSMGQGGWKRSGKRVGRGGGVWLQSRVKK